MILLVLFWFFMIFSNFAIDFNFVNMSVWSYFSSLSKSLNQNLKMILFSKKSKVHNTSQYCRIIVKNVPNENSRLQSRANDLFLKFNKKKLWPKVLLKVLNLKMLFFQLLIFWLIFLQIFALIDIQYNLIYNKIK